MTSAAKELAGAAFNVGVFGVGPVAAMLVADEVERSRCGIGCILEKVDGKFVVHRTMTTPNQNDAADSALEEGDIILKVDEHWLHSWHTIEEASALIRGTEGTPVQLLVSKWKNVRPQELSIMRRRLPGAKAEMLGALWQTPTRNPRQPQPLTLEDKLMKLEELRARGNLTLAEYELAQKRLKEGSVAHREKEPDAPFLPSAKDIATALSDDLQRMLGIHRQQAVAIVSDRLVKDLALDPGPSESRPESRSASAPRPGPAARLTRNASSSSREDGTVFTVVL